MEDLEGKLSAALSSPETMEKIMGMMRALGLGASETSEAPETSDAQPAADGMSTPPALHASEDVTASAVINSKSASHAATSHRVKYRPGRVTPAADRRRKADEKQPDPLPMTKQGKSERKKEELKIQEKPQKKEENSPFGLDPGLIGALLGGIDLPDLSFMSTLSKLDPKILTGIMRLMGEYGKGNDEREALLIALKPYLRVERRDKIDKAVQIVRLARTGKVALTSFMGSSQNTDT